jgi:O-antigen ligase
LLAGLTTIFWTTRRVAIAALLLIGLIYGWLIARRQRRHLLILVAALAVMVALVLTNKSYMFRIRQIVELDILYSGDSPRIIVWTAGLDALREHWLLGMGAYNFPTWIHRVWGWPAEFEQHNLTLQLLTEVGLPGLLIFGAFVVAVLIRVRAGLRAALAHGGLRDASMLAAALSSFAAMLLYAQAQPFLLDTLIFVPAALCSVGAELALRRFPAEPAADGTPVEPVDVYE